jgi:hypothetical protein
MSTIADLAGLLRALDHLRPEDDATRRRIGQHFGIMLMQQAGAQPAKAPPDTARPAPLRRSFAEALAPVPRRERPKPLPTHSERLDAQRNAPPAWLGARTLPLAAAAAPLPPGAGARSPADALCLLPGASRRTLLLEMTGTREADGALDVARLVQAVAMGRNIARLPRRAVRRLPPRIILLLDEGPGMEPFAADQLALATALRKVAGSDRVQTLCFTGSIADGLRDPLTDSAATLRPGPTDALVVTSDVGIARQYPAARLEDFAGLARQGRKVVILNPFPPQRWPPAQAGGPVLLHWHEGLRIGEVRRAGAART